MGRGDESRCTMNLPVHRGAGRRPWQRDLVASGGDLRVLRETLRAECESRRGHVDGSSCCLRRAWPFNSSPPSRRFRVTRSNACSAPLTIDGKLDEPAWAAAPAVTLQFLWESQTGAKQMTRARLLWDAQALYVGFDADDADITAQFQQRDDPTYRDDAVEIFINPNPQQEVVYYGFEMNARGVLYDYLNYNSRTLFKRFDATGVKIATSLRGTLNVRTDTDNGWSLEAMIPWPNFEELSRRPPVAGTVWKVEFQSLGRRRAEPPHEHLVRPAEQPVVAARAVAIRRDRVRRIRDRVGLTCRQSAACGAASTAVLARARPEDRGDSSPSRPRPSRACPPCIANSTDRCRGTTRRGVRAWRLQARPDRTATRDRAGCASPRSLAARRSGPGDTSRSPTPRRFRRHRPARSRSAETVPTGAMPANPSLPASWSGKWPW